MIMGFGWQELGALGSFLAGISTMLAFGGTLYLIVRERRSRRLAEADRESERRDNERRQARLVYATLDYPPRRDDGAPEETQEFSEVHVRVFNHSSEPIWDVQLPIPGRKHRPLLIEMVAPKASETNGWLDAPVDWYLDNVGAGCPGTPYWVSLDVLFVDNSGRRWRRTGRAEPVRLTDNEDRR